jgi:hypothetical protein
MSLAEFGPWHFRDVIEGPMRQRLITSKRALHKTGDQLYR